MARRFLGRPGLGGVLTMVNLVAVGGVYVMGTLTQGVPQMLAVALLLVLAPPVGCCYVMPDLVPRAAAQTVVMIGALVVNAFVWGHGLAWVFYRMGYQDAEPVEISRMRRCLCRVCEYDLRGSLGSERCPECGTEITRDARYYGGNWLRTLEEGSQKGKGRF